MYVYRGAGAPNGDSSHEEPVNFHRGAENAELVSLEEAVVSAERHRHEAYRRGRRLATAYQKGEDESAIEVVRQEEEEQHHGARIGGAASCASFGREKASGEEERGQLLREPRGPRGNEEAPASPLVPSIGGGNTEEEDCGSQQAHVHHDETHSLRENVVAAGVIRHHQASKEH